jgi:hypothetical protein
MAAAKKGPAPTGLAIETFRHEGARHYGTTPFKALGHPMVATKGRDLAEALKNAGPVAVFDPDGLLASFAALYALAPKDVAAVFVQRTEDTGRKVLGRTTQPVHLLARSKARTVFVAAFDADRVVEHVKVLRPDATCLSFDAMRLPKEWLSNPRKYLDTVNFVTNFAFLRDEAGHHTAVRTANYWGGYGATDGALWACLFDADGNQLAEWTERLPDPNASLTIDSRAVRRRFGLGDFTGSLFLHALRIKGHDIVKYALDTYGDDGTVLSATHDANAWPADLYAGLPAPASGERVVLWVQNSHPIPIPAGAVSVAPMGSKKATVWKQSVPPFGTRAMDVGALLPKVRWPQQLEVHAGRYFVRPRYEIARGARTRIAHANVERTDLQHDPAIAKLGAAFGKGFLLPFPIAPTARFRTLLLPTPMATGQRSLPVAVTVYDARGKEIAKKRLGKLPRNHATMVDVDALLKGKRTLGPLGDFGHAELTYDHAKGGDADGWLHAIARYEDRRTGHIAETSFGAHIFNTLAVYKDEPQSYSGPPPGLSTRLFMRLGPAPAEAFCHLVYAASLPWRPRSETALVLTGADGREVASETVRIACGGSLLWKFSDVFDAATRATAGPDSYLLVRDTTCRLFGFHGLDTGAAFSLDHMFGF